MMGPGMATRLVLAEKAGSSGYHAVAAFPSIAACGCRPCTVCSFGLLAKASEGFCRSFVSLQGVQPVPDVCLANLRLFGTIRD